MSKLLLELLDVPEAEFNRYIHRLESVCLNPAVDIRLSAEIQSLSRSRAGQLGLDIHDTTPKEYYYALKGRLFDDDQKLKTLLKLHDEALDDTAKKIAKVTTKLSKNEYSLAVTTSGLRRILKAVPPRKTMRLLRLRSIDSFIKRYDARLVYCLAFAIEDHSWVAQAHAKISRLAVKDITWQRVEVIHMPLAWYEKVSAKLGTQFFVSCRDSGTVCVLPTLSGKTPGIITYCVGAILQEVQQISGDSLMYRYSGIMHDYTTAVLEMSAGTVNLIESIHGLEPSWHAVHELLGRGHVLGDFEPELLVGELEWQSVEMKLAALISEFDFWVGNHYIGVKTGTKPVSLHFLDVARSVVADLQFDDRVYDHCRGSLWNELQIRYMQQDSISRLLAKQLQMKQEVVLL